MRLHSDKVVEKPIIYLSGYMPHVKDVKKSEAEFLKRTGLKFRCYSFAYTCPGMFYYYKQCHESLDYDVKKGIGIFMDSGAFSFHQFVDKHGGSATNKKRKYGPDDVEKLKDEVIDRYVKYCKAQDKNWDFYVNFDYVRNGPIVYKVQKQLEKAGLHPAPVFHGYYPIEWMERYCKEGYKLIAVSGIARQQKTFRQTQAYCDQVHNVAAKYGVKLHGLAVTSASLLFGFPWYSSDSATWLRNAAMGCVTLPDLFTKTLINVHVSPKPASHDPSYNKMQKHQRHQLERIIEEYGFDFKKVREDIIERRVFNACVYVKHLGPIAKEIRDSVARWESLV